MTFHFSVSVVLFLCFRGFALVGPFVVMIYQMLKRDFLIFFVIYMIFVIGFSQGEWLKVISLIYVVLTFDWSQHSAVKPEVALRIFLQSKKLAFKQLQVLLILSFYCNCCLRTEMCMCMQLRQLHEVIGIIRNSDLLANKNKNHKHKAESKLNSTCEMTASNFCW